MAKVPVGRNQELTTIGRFLDAVPDGARVLHIVGAAGIGKSTLWLRGVAGAEERSWRVLTARPSEVEAGFAYAGLGDLLAAIEDGVLELLPAPQRRALRVAMLQEDPAEASQDHGAVAVALLGLLRRLAGEGPVLVAVDDIQWLDEPSWAALHYVVRRLGTDAIGFLLASRTEDPSAARRSIRRLETDLHTQELAVEPLGIAALGDLVQTEARVPVGRLALQRIHALSGGNPLFALELARTLDVGAPKGLADSEILLSDDLIAIIGARVADLPAATRAVLEFAAESADPTLQRLHEATGTEAEAVLQPAVDGNIAVVDGDRVGFTHPLRAAAVRTSMSTARRREVHRRLAEVMPDSEERARHLALAADGPDERTAMVLELAAKQAYLRGAPHAAADLAALAGALTPRTDLTAIRRRGMMEASDHSRVGDVGRAKAIVDGLLETSPTGRERWSLLVLQATIEYGIDVWHSIELLRAALVEIEDDRLRLRCQAQLTAALDVLGLDVDAAIAAGEAELETAQRLGDSVRIATVRAGLARNLQRRSGTIPTDLLERSLADEPLVRATPGEFVSSWPSWFHAEMLCWTDDLEAGLVRLDELCQVTQERGDEGAYRQALVGRSLYGCVAGSWGRALDDTNEALGLYVGSGSMFRNLAVAVRALIKALLGDEAAARRDAAEAAEIGSTAGMLKAVRVADWAVGLLELSLGQPARAHARLGPLVDQQRTARVEEPGELRFVTDEIEALIAMGAFEEAESLLEWFEGLATSSGRAFAIAACQRSRGLLHRAHGRLGEATEALARSRGTYATTTDPFGAARTLLALGSVQRQARRRKASRETLHSALEAFEQLGARQWAKRVRGELGRIGGRAPSPEGLTPSERNVATLVTEGLTNREVAARLVVTERTVEGHLSSIYAKLGIRSRTELARRLASEDGEAISGGSSG